VKAARYKELGASGQPALAKRALAIAGAAKDRVVTLRDDRGRCASAVSSG
jgi:hypothetical protein